MTDELRLLLETFNNKLDNLERDINSLKGIMSEQKGAATTNSKWLNAFYGLLLSGFAINVFDAIMDLKKYHL